MKILVTGAAGFMGYHLLKHLTKEGNQVIGLDNFSIGNNKHPSTIDLDLTHKDSIDYFMKAQRFDVLYHLAAWAHEGLSQFSPIRITENNYFAYLNVLTPFIKYGGKHVVLTSSMSVYGDQEPPFNEKMERKPMDVYAVAKTSMERVTEILSKVHGFRYSIVRPHNVYGPGQVMSDPYRNVVAIFINKTLKNEPFYIYGDGKQKRAFSYIDDVIPYLAKAVDYHGEIINIGPLEEYSINKLGSEVLRAFNSTLVPIHVEDRPLEVKNAWCTNDKAQKLLGYKTTVPLREGITRMVAWAKTVGPQETKYLDNLELETENTPITWKEHLI